MQREAHKNDDQFNIYKTLFAHTSYGAPSGLFGVFAGSGAGSQERMMMAYVTDDGDTGKCVTIISERFEEVIDGYAKQLAVILKKEESD